MATLAVIIGTMHGDRRQAHAFLTHHCKLVSRFQLIKKQAFHRRYSTKVPFKQRFKLPLYLTNDASDEEDYLALQVERILKNQYPSFHSLLSKNENIWTTLSELTTDFTLFVPNQQAFDNLGPKRIKQLKDDRNLETAQKIGLYHVVATEALTPAILQTEDWTVPKPNDGSPRPMSNRAVVTMAGRVSIGRTKKGGFFGWGAKEEGYAVLIGPQAKIVQSFQIVGKRGSLKAGTCIIHEMDSLISPEILWRYCDQLQIPIPGVG